MRGTEQFSERGENVHYPDVQVEQLFRNRSRDRRVIQNTINENYEMRIS